MKMLANNIVRMNGWKDGKRTHKDIEVRMLPNRVADQYGDVETMIPHYFPDELVKMCFDNDYLDAVTSYNAYNWVGKIRITTKL